LTSLPAKQHKKTVLLLSCLSAYVRPFDRLCGTWYEHVATVPSSVILHTNLVDVQVCEVENSSCRVWWFFWWEEDRLWNVILCNLMD